MTDMNPTNSELKCCPFCGGDELRTGATGAGEWLGEFRADDAVEQVAKAITEEIGWGTFSHFNPDDIRRISRAALSTLTPSPAVDLLRDIREAVTLAREALDDCDETEAHALLSNVQARIDAALKEAKDG